MIQDIHIDQTRYSPKIYLRDGTIYFEGRSILNDPTVFYKPIYSWIKQYVNSNPSSTQIDLKFEYINTSSIKWLFEMLKTFLHKPKIKDQLLINWYYEEGDDDMQELGEILKSLMHSRFNLIETEEN